MNKLFLIFAVLLLGFSLVSAENLCFSPAKSFEKSPLLNSPFSNLILPKIPFPENKEGSRIIVFQVLPEKIIPPKKVLITENGFEPKTVWAKANQTIVWKNGRKQTPALVYGVREISGMKSGYIFPAGNFSWSFLEPGVYTYVDAVVLGKVGKIVVG